MKKISLAILVLAFFALTMPTSSSAAIRTVTTIKKASSLKASISVDSSKLRWTKVSKTKYYKVQLKKKNGKKVKTWTKRNKNWVKITNHVDAGKKYKYRVRGCKGERCGKWSKYKYFNTNELVEEIEEETVPTPDPEPTPEPESIVGPEPTPEPDPVSYDCSYNKYNCDDFDYQSEAQDAHDYCMSEVGEDIYDLDRDGNGLACESLD